MIAFTTGIILAFLTSSVRLEDEGITRATVESCTGCYLNKYPEVKMFIELDIPNFEGVTFKSVPGAPPEMVFFNRYDEELERHSLKGMSREACSNLLLQKGFKRFPQKMSKDKVHKDL